MKVKPINIPDVYQLKVQFIGISPMIWRRILVKSNSTIRDLHFILQILMDWDDYYLHQFIIRGKRYGISWECGVFFDDDADQIFLSDFNFYLNEKFIYEYNFFSEWRIQIRVEKSFHFDARKTYPCCISGSRQAPHEECQGAWSFMALQQKYSKWYLLDRVVDILKGNDDDDIEDLKYWLKIDRFNRRSVNKCLKQYLLGLDPYDV